MSNEATWLYGKRSLISSVYLLRNCWLSGSVDSSCCCLLSSFESRPWTLISGRWTTVWRCIQLHFPFCTAAIWSHTIRCHASYRFTILHNIDISGGRGASCWFFEHCVQSKDKIKSLQVYIYIYTAYDINATNKLSWLQCANVCQCVPRMYPVLLEGQHCQTKERQSAACPGSPKMETVWNSDQTANPPPLALIPHIASKWDNFLSCTIRPTHSPRLVDATAASICGSLMYQHDSYKSLQLNDGWGAQHVWRFIFRFQEPKVGSNPTSMWNPPTPAGRWEMYIHRRRRLCKTVYLLKCS